MMAIIYADWPAPAHIVAGTTTCSDGMSMDCYASNNLALHVGDDASTVLRNRQLLAQRLIVEQKSESQALQWQWLNQTHGVTAVEALTCSDGAVPDADACYSFHANTVCTVLTADCLPILLTDQLGGQVAAIHAGWRSLCGGVIESTVAAMQRKRPGVSLMAWLGPAIGPSQFEVGEDVLQAFSSANAIGQLSVEAFIAKDDGKYLADIYQLARIRLHQLGIDQIYGGHYCTVTEVDHFYSYRRQGKTGRMASFIFKRY